MSVVLGRIQGSSSGHGGSIALVLLGPGQVHVVESGWVKVLELLGPVGKVIQSSGDLLRHNADLDDSGVGDEGVVDWKSFSGVVGGICHNSSIGGNIGLDNGGGTGQFLIGEV